MNVSLGIEIDLFNSSIKFNFHNIMLKVKCTSLLEKHKLYLVFLDHPCYSEISTADH